MSLQQERQNCVVCKAYIFEDDDIVYCPICGAPHHRECYNSVGHCELQHLHGTPEQYQKKTSNSTVEEPTGKSKTHRNSGNSVKMCPYCMKKVDKDANVCPYCGRHIVNTAYFNIDLSGGVSDDTDLGDGVTAGQAKEFVFVNTRRYLPKFFAFKEGAKTSFNWLAFLIPQGWFFSRKMYKAGALVFTILIALQILLFPLNMVLNQNVFTDYSEMSLYVMNYLNESMANGDYFPLVMTLIGTIGPIIVRIIAGFSADKIYYKHTLERIKAAGKSKLSKEEYNHKYGGVSILAGLLGILAFNYLPNIIFMLF